MNKTYTPSLDLPDRIPSPKARSYLKESLSIFFSNKVASLAGYFLFFILIASIFIPIASPYSYFETSLSHKNELPSIIHWFGTDELGRGYFYKAVVGRTHLFTHWVCCCYLRCTGRSCKIIQNKCKYV